MALAEAQGCGVPIVDSSERFSSGMHCFLLHEIRDRVGLPWLSVRIGCTSSFCGWVSGMRNHDAGACLQLRVFVGAFRGVIFRPCILS